MLSRRNFVRGTGSVLAVAALPEIALASAHANQQETWLALAESLKPTLHEEVQLPVSLVRPVADRAAYLRWRMEVVSPAVDLETRTFNAGESFLLDFGGHRTGYLSFDIHGVGNNIDAPARLRFTFGEVLGDVAEALHPYKGRLGEGWLPEDTVTLDSLPQSVRLPRRYAFRYVKVEVLGTSPSYAAAFKNFHAHAVTSARNLPPPLPANTSAALQAIDAVSLATLRDCMQTTFEDGPRRDQRLWIGDMRLQALANYKTFRNFALVKRCLYLFAAFPREDGLMRACVFEKPTPHPSGDFILDYAALYVAALYDYVAHSGDHACGLDLWPVAKRQLDLIGANVNSDGLFLDPGNIWIFIDWEKELHRNAAMHGVLLYCYRQAIKLAKILGKHDDATRFESIVSRMTSAARKSFYDANREFYTSGPDHQVSLASQAWLILAEVDTKAVGSKALRNAMAHPGVVMPSTPYLYHHVVSAMRHCGMHDEATALLEQYWGGMVRAGADTFWEVYDQHDSLASPYGDVHINSFCHAWSCTPAYLLRTEDG